MRLWVIRRSVFEHSLRFLPWSTGSIGGIRVGPGVALDPVWTAKQELFNFCILYKGYIVRGLLKCMWMLANIFYQFIPDQTKSNQNSIEVNYRTHQTIRTKSNAIALNSILLGILFFRSKSHSYRMAFTEKLPNIPSGSWRSRYFFSASLKTRVYFDLQ